MPVYLEQMHKLLPKNPIALQGASVHYYYKINFTLDLPVERRSSSLRNFPSPLFTLLRLCIFPQNRCQHVISLIVQ